MSIVKLRPDGRFEKTRVKDKLERGMRRGGGGRTWKRYWEDGGPSEDPGKTIQWPAGEEATEGTAIMTSMEEQHLGGPREETKIRK